MRLNINRSVEHNDYISLTVARSIALNDISNAECCGREHIPRDNHKRKQSVEPVNNKLILRQIYKSVIESIWV